MPVSVSNHSGSNHSGSDLLAPGAHGAVGGEPVRIALRSCDVVQVLARKGRAGDVAAALLGALGLVLPGPGHAAEGRGASALWVQPEGWFVVAPRGADGALASAIKAACGDAASVIDQSHGRAVVSISGTRAAWVLAKSCRVDLHPSAFGPGRVASTQLFHLAATLHQTDAVPSFDLIVFSTFLRSFLESLTHAAEETGYVVA